jgi:NAD(P)-dependent dehydrogenase (short-subunit alcohol dehydrogenase family)
MPPPGTGAGLALIIGASRGLGLGLAREYLGRGWRISCVQHPQDSAPLLFV